MAELIEDRIRSLFSAAGADAFLHVEALDEAGRPSVGLGAHTPVATASVIKIVFCLAFARGVADGRIDPAERVDVPAELRVGGTGTTGCQDPVQMSLRDLALSMMTVSDNAATDIVVGRAGRPAIEATLNDLGLTNTHFRADMRTGHMRAVRELDLPSPLDLDEQVQRADPAAIWGLAWIDPNRANASTPREITRLLGAIWTDRAGPPDACAFVRTAMAQQVSEARLASGFDQPGVRIAGKTGTLPAIRNEAGVVTYPDGRRYAAAIFTRADTLTPRRPAIDAAIGAAARAAVDHLRALG